MLVALIPFRSLSDGKRRLAGVLEPRARTALLDWMLESTVAAAMHASAIDAVCVVSRDQRAIEIVAEMGALPVLDPGRGLNPALDLARRRMLDAGASGVLVLPTDLALLTPEALDGFAGEVLGSRASLDGEPTVGIVPDRHGLGTNALLLSPPLVVRFQFGPTSCRAHLEEAEAVGAQIVRREGPLGFDLDTADDFRDVQRLCVLGPAGGLQALQRGATDLRPRALVRGWSFPGPRRSSGPQWTSEVGPDERSVGTPPVDCAALCPPRCRGALAAGSGPPRDEPSRQVRPCQWRGRSRVAPGPRGGGPGLVLERCDGRPRTRVGATSVTGSRSLRGDGVRPLVARWSVQPRRRLD